MPQSYQHWKRKDVKGNFILKISWKTVQGGISVSNISLSQSNTNDSNSLAILEPDHSLNMFWIDAFEKSGIIYIFGKVSNNL